MMLAALVGAVVVTAPPPPTGDPATDLAQPFARLAPAAGPPTLPAWMRDPRPSEVFYRRGPYAFAVYRDLPELARDLNGVAVGHALAYEDLVTGRAARLETDTFAEIDRVLKNPPRLMPAERFLSPRFSRTYAALEKVFDWTHVLHAQTIDALVDARLSPEAKEREIEALWRFYKSAAPYTITGLPLNMGHLDAQSYSGAFRRAYPKVNGLFWGYHWLQTSIYDALWVSRGSLADQRAQYKIIGPRYRQIELYRTDRDVMPMMAETSPLFSRRFPEIANAFDNLHMLHDMVNDILASPNLSERRKAEQIDRAIWMVSDAAHLGERPGSYDPKSDGFHDHRTPDGQPGMGMMTLSSPSLMFMPGMGWMNMAECGHCQMPFPREDGGAGATVSIDGWTMEVRCALCARDMAAQSSGEAIIRANTEDPRRPLILISDDAGNMTANLPNVVFLEVPGPHASCSAWSRAFTNRAAFDAYVKSFPDDEEIQSAKPLSLAEWSARNGGEPDTLEKREGPVPNPYRRDGGSR